MRSIPFFKETVSICACLGRKRVKYGTKVTLKTWARAATSFFTLRDFEMYDAQNHLVCIASTKWTLIDINKGGMIRIPADVIGTYEPQDDRKVFDEDDEITLYEKIQNIKAKEVKDTNSSAYLLDGILTKKFETGPIETMHLFGYYRGSVDMDLSNGGDSVYDFSAIQAGINGKFRGGQNYYEARFRFDPV